MGVTPHASSVRTVSAHPALAIRTLAAAEFEEFRSALCALLADAVADNASVGFVWPLAESELDAYWRAIGRDLATGDRCVLVAFEDRELVGSVQLSPSSKANQAHRADVQKLLVMRSARGRGVGAALMRALEREAEATGRWLLTLDTREGSVAESFYRKTHWIAIGRVPDYARDPDRTLAACTFFYKRLAGAP